jgi:hypothetical protein
MKELIRRPAREIIASFGGDVVVDLDGLHCATRFGIVSPGEPGYQPLYDPRATHTLEDWDRFLVNSGRASRAPTEPERRAALNGSLFGWHVPGADPLNCADAED